ncbi:provirus ancestral Env polyprotein [Plecturocebus cupreus]
MLQTPHHRSRRAAFLPLAVGLSLASLAVAAGLGGGALAQTHSGLAQLASQFQAAIDNSAESLASLQRQITSVAQVALQNRRALDLLMAGQGVPTAVFPRMNSSHSPPNATPASQLKLPARVKPPPANLTPYLLPLIAHNQQEAARKKAVALFPF